MVECEQNMAEVARPWRGGGELKYDAGTWVKPKDEDRLIRSLMNRKKNDKRLEDKRIAAKKKGELDPKKLKLMEHGWSGPCSNLGEQ